MPHAGSHIKMSAATTSSAWHTECELGQQIKQIAATALTSPACRTDSSRLTSRTASSRADLLDNDGAYSARNVMPRPPPAQDRPCPMTWSTAGALSMLWLNGISPSAACRPGPASITPLRARSTYAARACLPSIRVQSRNPELLSRTSVLADDQWGLLLGQVNLSPDRAAVPWALRGGEEVARDGHPLRQLSLTYRAGVVLRAITIWL